MLSHEYVNNKSKKMINDLSFVHVKSIINKHVSFLPCSELTNLGILCWSTISNLSWSNKILIRLNPEPDVPISLYPRQSVIMYTSVTDVNFSQAELNLTQDYSTVTSQILFQYATLLSYVLGNCFWMYKTNVF